MRQRTHSHSVVCDHCHGPAGELGLERCEIGDGERCLFAGSVAAASEDAEPSVRDHMNVPSVTASAQKPLALDTPAS